MGYVATLFRHGSLLQQMLGHSSIVTTQHYARVSDDMVRRDVEGEIVASWTARASRTQKIA